MEPQPPTTRPHSVLLWRGGGCRSTTGSTYVNKEKELVLGQWVEFFMCSISWSSPNSDFKREELGIRTCQPWLRYHSWPRAAPRSQCFCLQSRRLELRAGWWPHYAGRKVLSMLFRNTLIRIFGIIDNLYRLKTEKPYFKQKCSFGSQNGRCDFPSC